MRARRPRAGHLLALRQAGARRPALPRILRVPPRPRGAGRARGAAARGPAHRLADALRAAARRRAAPGLAGPPRPLPLRPPGRPEAAAADPRRRPAAGARGRAAPPGVRPGLRILRLLGRRFPPRRPERARRGAARRRGPDPGAVRGRPPRRRRVAGRHRGPADGPRPHRARALRGQRRRPLGRAGAGRPGRGRRRPARPPGQGQPPDHAQVLGGAAGLPAAEHGQAGDLRQPLRGRRAGAHRHHRRPGRGLGRRDRGLGRGGRVPAGGRQPLLRPPAPARATSSTATPACVRSTTTRPRTPRR